MSRTDMDPSEPTEVDISEYCPKGTKQCSSCWICLPFVSFEKDKEGHFARCSSCRNKKTSERKARKRKRANSTSVSSISILINSGKKTPEQCQIEFLGRKETAINWKAGIRWL